MGSTSVQAPKIEPVNVYKALTDTARAYREAAPNIVQAEKAIRPEMQKLALADASTALLGDSRQARQDSAAAQAALDEARGERVTLEREIQARIDEIENRKFNPETERNRLRQQKEDYLGFIGDTQKQQRELQKTAGLDDGDIADNAAKAKKLDDVIADYKQAIGVMDAEIAGGDDYLTTEFKKDFDDRNQQDLGKIKLELDNLKTTGALSDEAIEQLEGNATAAADAVLDSNPGMVDLADYAVKRQFETGQELKKAAADMVKNNVPNYAFVSDYINGLRQLPVGNFVAFPAEIIRTSANIVETALKEINYSTVINGKTVNPLRARGLQRLTGMALTTAALPLGTVAAAQAVYNIADDEIDAMRRYVADWSKNSVLVPFKDDDGKLSYVDFSHLNAYDTVTSPIQTVLNAVNSGRADEDGLIDDFVLGMFESTKELGSPFISESIWTAGLADIFVRGGETRDNRKLWNDKDSIGDKMSKSIGHLVDTQMPLNWKQMQRIGLSLYPVNSLGKFDERGNQYDLGNELAGIAGLRRVEVNPEKSFNYKITNYKKGIRDSRNLFTAATLKGGVVTPEQIVDAYINSNRALYETNREMFLDMEAAKTLGMSEDKLAERMVNRGESTSFGFLTEGLFRPLTISGDVQGLFETKAREIGVRNPFEAAYDVIGRIQEVLSEVPLNGDLFPDIKNPLSSALLPDVVGQANQLLNNNPANAAMATAPGFIGQQNTNIDPVTRLTSAEEVLLDPLEQRYVKNKRTNTKLT